MQDPDLADDVLIAVDVGGVDMTVAAIQGRLQSDFELAGVRGLEDH